jgi:2-polyprenyl-3-methyl-5-hydroxy-6-metoxy-1,4-benzoquinol methylase
MMNKKDEHETIYQGLKESGYKGWGGVSYDSRMNGWDDSLNKIFKTINLSKGKVLELGCGSGDVSIKIAEMGYEVIGVDFSPTAIEWAREKANSKELSIEFLSQNVCEEDLLSGNQYELIIDGNCLHCLFDEERTMFYTNVKRLLSKTGVFYVGSAISSPGGDSNPQISSIDRCILTQEALEKELELMGFVKMETWIIEHKTHNHYRGLFHL